MAPAFSAGLCHAAATHFLPHCLPCLLERNMDSTRKLKTQVDSHGKRTKSSADRTHHPLHYLGTAKPSTVVVLLPRITIRVCQVWSSNFEQNMHIHMKTQHDLKIFIILQYIQMTVAGLLLWYIVLFMWLCYSYIIPTQIKYSLLVLNHLVICKASSCVVFGSR